MDVTITPRAARDLDDIWMFVAESAGVASADTLMDEMFETIDRLRTMAHRGRLMMEVDGRPIRTVMVRRAWTLFYAAGADSVSVLRVTGARRNFADILKDLD